MKTIILLSLVLLSGCAAFETREHYKGTEAGFLVASVGITNGSARDPIYTVNFEHDQDKNEKFSLGLQLDNLFSKTIPDISDSKKEIIVSARRLKPGSYTITDWSVQINGGNVQFFHRSKPNFKMTFEIVKDQVTNIGQLLFNTHWAVKNNWMEKPGWFNIIHAKTSAEEKKIARSKISVLQNSSIIK